MSKVKKIISDIAEAGLEVVKDSAKQIGQTVSPDKLLESVIGPKKSSNEFSEYLKNLGNPDLSQEELEEQKKKFEKDKEDELEKARRVLRGEPAHMKLPPKQEEERPYEKTWQEEEQKKALAVEAQKKQAQPLVIPKSKPKGRVGVTSQKATTEGLKKDTKIG